MKRIAIHSVPRSGSTWLGEIFNSHPEVIYKYQPLFSYAFKGRLTPTSTLEDIKQFYNEISISDDDFVNQKQARENGKMPIFQKSKSPSHICYKEVRYHHLIVNILKQDREIKIIGLIRNPLAVIYSWLNAPREFRKDLGWNKEEWREAPKKNLNRLEEFNGFEKWKEVSKLFLRLENEYPTQFKTVSYSDLLINPEVEVEAIFSFCNLNFSKNTKQFIFQSKIKDNTDAYSVYKKKSNDNGWKDNLNNEIVNSIINELKNTTLEKYLNHEV